MSGDRVFIDAAEPVFGVQVGRVWVRVHGREVCEGRGIPCCVHAPSGHHMVGWPMNWRGDVGVMERLCPSHGVGHPDPDHLAYVFSLTPAHECPMMDGGECEFPHLEWQSIHGCCGCCVSPE